MIEDVEAGLRANAARIRQGAAAFGQRRTSADAPTGEQWELGQVLSHVAEFLPYWVEQLQVVVAAGGGGKQFGRTRATASRLERIEGGRHRPTAELIDAMDAGIAGAVGFAHGLSAADWELVGTHVSLGEMSVAQAFAAFIVAHLGEHADQLTS